jgi:hypothetical protein
MDRLKDIRMAIVPLSAMLAAGKQYAAGTGDAVLK